MMAHKELASQYAKQLSDCQQRIIELEIAVADVRAELEQAQAKVDKQQISAGTAPKAVPTRFADKEKRIAELTEQLKVQTSKVKSLEGPVARAHALRLEAANKLAVSLEASLDARTKSKKRWKAKALSAENRSSAEAATQETNELLVALKESERAINELKAEKDTQGANLVAANSRNLALQKELDESRKSVENLTTIQDTQVKKLTTANNRNVDLQMARNSETAALKREVRSLNTTIRTKDELSKERIAELETSLDRERKRKREAEAMLGPDGRRCKKCNPVVIDLDNDDDDGALPERQRRDESTAPPTQQHPSGEASARPELPETRDKRDEGVRVTTRGAAKRAAQLADAVPSVES